MTALAPAPEAVLDRRPRVDRAPEEHRAWAWTSALYEGHVRHHRHRPVDHRFETPVSMVLLDLDELPQVVDALPLWSSRRPAPVHFRREDYLDGTTRPLRDAVAELVERRTGHRPDGPILMLTQLRRFGWLFNPLTIYWCLTPPSGRGTAATVATVVLEVTNTPWGERHHYVVDTDGRRDGLRFPKVLHVSPFLGEDLTYTLAFATPTEGLVVRLGVDEGDEGDERVLDTELTLHRRRLTRAAVLADLARHPGATARVSATIHAQALRLAGKGVPRVAHPTGTPTRWSAPLDRVAATTLRRLTARLAAPVAIVEADVADADVTAPDVADAAGGRTIRVRDRHAYRAVVGHASVGLGESYARGWWDTDDLPGLLGDLHAGIRRFDRWRDPLWNHPVTRAAHRLTDAARAAGRQPDRGRDRANIAAHYDLGNDFFATFLDDTMSYSAARFDRPGLALGEAQRAKLDRLCSLLELGPADHLVELGSGWGGLAVHAAERAGCRVTTTTISAAQRAVALDRVAAAGLDDRVDVLDLHYRDLTGTYDKLVSVEMIEAIDWREVDEFFAACHRLLRPGGVMALQAIVIADEHYERAKNEQDFVKACIFPGGCLPSVSSIQSCVRRAGDLELVAYEHLGADYAETLRHWRANLHAQDARLRALGLDDTFLRLWDFYLCYCEAAFDQRAVSVIQARLRRPA